MQLASGSMVKNNQCQETHYHRMMLKLPLVIFCIIRHIERRVSGWMHKGRLCGELRIGSGPAWDRYAYG